MPTSPEQARHPAITQETIDLVRSARHNPDFYTAEQASLDPILLDFMATESYLLLRNGPITQETLLQFGTTLLAISWRGAEVAALEDIGTEDE